MTKHTICAALFALAACKGKSKTTDTSAPTPESAKPAEAAKPAACPAGTTNPDNLGVCVKLIDGLKPNANVGHSGTQKAIGWTADGDVDISIKTGEYDSMFWDQSIKDLLAGGGFGGKLIDQTKVGDGVTATFSADDGPRERRLLITRIHNDKIYTECWAEKQIMSSTGPKLDDVLAVCKNATLAP